jgi:hypothetical protein
MENLKCLVIDNSYMPRTIISTERAFAIVYKGNAEALFEYDKYFKLASSNTLKIKKPCVIRVFKYVNQPFHRIALTRQNVFKRDNHKCVYCSETNKKLLTIDHVVPQSKGGPNTWENLVTACKSCNCEKDNLSLDEWGKIIPKPFRPHYLMLVRNLGVIPEDWKNFLFL